MNSVFIIKIKIFLCNYFQMSEPSYTSQDGVTSPNKHVTNHIAYYTWQVMFIFKTGSTLKILPCSSFLIAFFKWPTVSTKLVVWTRTVVVDIPTWSCVYGNEYYFAAVAGLPGSQHLVSFFSSVVTLNTSSEEICLIYMYMARIKAREIIESALSPSNVLKLHTFLT